MKKPKLSRYIIKACIIAFVLFAIFYVVAMYVVDFIYSKNQKNYNSKAEDGIETEIRERLLSSDPEIIMKEGLKSEEYGPGLAALDFHIKTYPMASFAMLYDHDGNVISDPSKAVFFKVLKKNEKNEEDVVRLETEYNDEWKEIFELDHYNEKIGDNDYGLPGDMTFEEAMEGENYTELGSHVVMDEIYVKGGYFVPGKVHVRVTLSSDNKDDNFFELSKDVLDKDMTPDNPEDYTKITMSSEKDAPSENGYYYYDDFSPSVVGVFKEDVHWKDYEYFLNKMEKDGFSVDKLVKESEFAYSEYSETYEFDKEFMHHLDGIVSAINVNKDIEGPEYVLITLSDHSILSATNVQIFGAFEESESISLVREIWIPRGLLFLVIFVVIFSVIAGFRYMKAKSAYDMKCYRIETTNTMAHDLKTPLAAISGYAENLLEQVQVDKREYYAKAILSDIDYMDQMIYDILELSKSEDERQSIDREEIVLHEFVDAEMNNFEHIVKERGLKVSIAGDKKVRTDRKLLKSLVDNLLSNAVKYSAPDSEIVIQLGESAGLFKSINANGFTISNKLEEPLENTAEELVKPYVKGDNSRSGRNGSGVGLTIVENVARKLKYKVSYDITDEEFLVCVRM